MLIYRKEFATRGVLCRLKNYNRFRPGHDAPPELLVRWGGGHPSQFLSSLDAEDCICLFRLFSNDHEIFHRQPAFCNLRISI